MYKYFFKLIILVICTMFFTTSCVLDIQNSIDKSLSAEWIEINYDQIKNNLFLQIEIQSGQEIVDSVITKITSENFDTTLYLNDNGTNGDIIANNNRFSTLVKLNMPFEKFHFNAFIFTNSQNVYQKLNYFSLEQQFPPEIIDIIFWEKNADGTEKIIDPNSDPFQVEENIYKYLYFQLIINDANGLEDIQYVRYQINVENMSAEDSCQYIPDTGFLNYPQWYLEYKEKNDLGFVFDIKNEFLDDPNTDIDEPGLQIKPLNLCGRTGISTFRFIIADKVFDPIIYDINLGFDK